MPSNLPNGHREFEPPARDPASLRKTSATARAIFAATGPAVKPVAVITAIGGVIAAVIELLRTLGVGP